MLTGYFWTLMKNLLKRTLTLSLALVIGLSAFRPSIKFDNDRKNPPIRLFNAIDSEEQEKE